MTFMVWTFQPSSPCLSEEEGSATQLGLRTSPDKDCPPSTNMACLSVEVDSEHFTLSVTATHVHDRLTELAIWALCEFYTVKQLKSLLRKLSFAAACITPGCIFISRLLNNLQAFPSTRPRLKVSADMQPDIDWWLTSLPLFNMALLSSNPGTGSLTICSLQQMPP